MKKFIIFLLCVAVIGGGSWFGYKRYMDKKQDSIVVDVVPVQNMMQYSDWFDYGSNECYGQVVASNTQRFYTDTQKLVKEVFVEEGQEVKKGDPILEYDMTVVELELEQKKNAVSIVEQNIKMAKKELEKIRNYKPSEDAPQMPDPVFPEFDDDDIGMWDMDDSFPYDDSLPDMSGLFDDSSSMPDAPPPQLVKDVVKPAFVPAEGNGTVESPYIINVTRSAEVSKDFMVRLAAEKKCAEICVYDENFFYLYKWIIVPSEETKTEELDSWKVADGVTFDENGQASIDTDKKLYGKLSFTQPTVKKPDDSSSQADDSSSMADNDSSVADDEYSKEYEDYMAAYDAYQEFMDNIDPNSNDYVYSRDAIKKMIAEKESDIKQLELSLKSAQFEYDKAKKRKEDGKLYAEIDGIVKKIGKASGEDDTEDDTAEATEEDIYEEPNEDDKAFAVIQGEGGVEVQCEIPELSLQYTQVGAELSIFSWNTNASGTAEVTSIDPQPVQYSSDNWGDNPNNSMYTVHAKITDNADGFTINDWIQVTIDKSTTNKSDSKSVYLPIHYVRQEGGDYYIMKADKDGRLEKQYVRVGQVMYGMMIEVKGGLKKSDSICFPYGKDVKEGVRTRETDTVLQPENVDIF